jgi:hypothetical protein
VPTAVPVGPGQSVPLRQVHSVRVVLAGRAAGIMVVMPVQPLRCGLRSLPTLRRGQAGRMRGGSHDRSGR